MLTAATLALLMQVGPFSNSNAAPPPVTAVPPELDELRRRQRTENTDLAPLPDRLQSCLARAEEDSTAGQIEANSWLSGAVGVTRAQALQCRGYAEANLGQWATAARSFLEARDDSESVDAKYRSRLGAMAANALLTADNVDQALTVLNRAKADAAEANFAALGAEIEIDRARAFVSQSDIERATEALTSARQLAPNSARAWLLSATLSRRSNDLNTAQTQIEQASQLDPTNPEIGLEAGVIAVLSGKDDAARKSWESIIAIAPESPQSETAKVYLNQLGKPAN